MSASAVVIHYEEAIYQVYAPFTSIIISSNKIQDGDILVPVNPGLPAKWLLKQRDGERKTERDSNRERDRTKITLTDNLFEVRKLVLVCSGNGDDLGSGRQVLSNAAGISAILIQSDKLRNFIVFVD